MLQTSIYFDVETLKMKKYNHFNPITLYIIFDMLNTFFS